MRIAAGLEEDRDRFVRQRGLLFQQSQPRSHAFLPSFLGFGPKTRGPEEPAKVGELVRGPPIELRPADVLKASVDLERRALTDPGLKDRLRKRPFPSSGSAQLEWALAYAPHADRLSDPLWLVATNDAAPALVAYVRGILAARKVGLVVDHALERRIVRERTDLYRRIAEDSSLYASLENAPFPQDPTQRIAWAIGVLLASWDPRHHADVRDHPEARAWIDLAAGVLAKTANNETSTEILAERRTIEVDGDVRVYAVHTPQAPRPPGGWPTLLFFHGSYGGYAPEQSPDYQAVNALADQHGFQVIYPVGTPQDRADLLRTGRGMLNWDPIGAGPDGANDRFVMQLLAQQIAAGAVDRTRVFAAGHSQGGFYVSNLITAYPRAFAGAAMFGAGAGSIAERVRLSELSRMTPLFLHAGSSDIHLPLANDFALKLQAAGHGSALRFVRPPGRGHELAPVDFERMFEQFGKTPSFEPSLLGTLDGSVADAPISGEIFRSFIDLSKPPEVLAQDPDALEMMRDLAKNSMLDLDGDDTRLTADEWRLALYHLAGWPSELQRRVADLRRYFVVAPPPSDVAFDLDRLPEKVAGDADARAALDHIANTPALDLDGYPALVSHRELNTAERYKDQMPEGVQRGLLALRAALARGRAA